ncbi:MAG TPA: hypothetical protein DDW52_10735, partial [Planctomycetaceae bacterium]|nr:hypothetical protein [Planctomycetaceae bacterium]
DGLWINYWVAAASRGVAVRSIHEHRDSLDSASRETLAKLLVSEVEPIEAVDEREKQWVLNSSWHSKLVFLLTRFYEESVSDSVFSVHAANLREVALNRLLAIELAIDDAIENGDALSRLTDLKWFVAEDLIDPYAGNDQLFRFRNDQHGTVVYSVGPDGEDDGGQEFWHMVMSSEGVDLEVETFMSDPEQAP